MTVVSTLRHSFFGLALAIVFSSVPGHAATSPNGLIALYDFQSTKGATVLDRSGFGEPLNLKIAKPRAVKRSKGSLRIVSPTIVKSERPAKKIIEAVKRSGAITLEAWIQTAKLGQAGPARVITISHNSNERNVTVGQDGTKIEARLRTSRTSNNGIPSISTDSRTLNTKLAHVVYTRERNGRARLYVNGRQRKAGTVAGDMKKWNSGYHLALGDELSGGRSWLGAFRLVAIYARGLSAGEVKRRFDSGPTATLPSVIAKAKRHPGEALFENKIAPLLSEHCLECHDTVTRKGKADLSRKNTAFVDDFIVPGKSAKSLIWELVESDEMPAKRTPLSPAEKQLLKQWIDGGAQWTVDVIDPAIYSHKQGTGQMWVQRLTIPEYIATVKAAVGVDVTKEAGELLPKDLRADGFSNTAYNLNVDLKHVASYAKLAEIIVGRMDVLKFTKRFHSSRKLIDKDNIALIENMGKWLLRGPLRGHETAAYRGIATTVMNVGGKFEDAMSHIIEAMLQSPRFIYRIESQRGDGTAYPVGEYEMANRLSYIIWGASPDRELLRAAEDSALSGGDQIAAQVERMLKDPRAITRSQQFISEWLNLGRLSNMRPNPHKFPNWRPELGEDMRAETLAFFKDLVWDQGRPLSELLNADFTYVTPRLAKHYGIRYDGKALGRVELASVRSRGGLLTHGSVLTIGGDEASMVTRGLFVLRDLLRGAIKDPPPSVNVTPVPTKEGLSQRHIAEQRVADANCGGCHVKFEPLAFGLEKFDGIGAFHDVDEHGNRLREDGEIVFPGTGKSISYRTSAQLMDLLAGSDRVKECLTWKLTQFALGRPLGADDARVVDNIHKSSQKNGGTYASVIKAIVLSDLVQMTRTEVASK